MTTEYSYRDLTGLTKFLKTLFIVGAVLSVLSILSAFMQLHLLQNSHITAHAANANDLRERVIGLVELALFIFTTVFVSIWIVRANRNVRVLGAKDLRITPGWAVGYFFIPIVNLWRPFHAMSDLWRASQNPADWTRLQVGALVPVWWTLWVLSAIIGRVVMQKTMAAQGLAEVETATWFQILNSILHIVICFVTLAMVLQIAAAQRNRYLLPVSATPVMPPPLN
jgi:hypothetical protein